MYTCIPIPSCCIHTKLLQSAAPIPNSCRTIVLHRCCTQYTTRKACSVTCLFTPSVPLEFPAPRLLSFGAPRLPTSGDPRLPCPSSSLGPTCGSLALYSRVASLYSRVAACSRLPPFILALPPFILALPLAPFILALPPFILALPQTGVGPPQPWAGGARPSPHLLQCAWTSSFLNHRAPCLTPTSATPPGRAGE